MMAAKNHIRQHIPGFADCTPKDGDFSTLGELEAIPFVASWKSLPNFIRFSKSDNHLMAEYAPTELEPAGSHWVIGYFRHAELVDLPQWKETEAQRERREAWNRGEIDDWYRKHGLELKRGVIQKRQT